MFCSACGNPQAATNAFCPKCGHLLPTPSASPGPTAAGYAPVMVVRFLDPETRRPLAEWWKRLVAYLVDGLILLLPNYVLVILAIFALWGYNIGSLQCPTTSSTCHLGDVADVIGWFVLYLVVVAALNGLYFILFIGSRGGQTPGMMMLGIAVRDQRDDVSIGFGRSFVRWIVMFALNLFSLPGIIDGLSPLWDRRRQAWHDHAAGSVVVDLR